MFALPGFIAAVPGLRRCGMLRRGVPAAAGPEAGRYTGRGDLYRLRPLGRHARWRKTTVRLKILRGVNVMVLS